MSKALAIYHGSFGRASIYDLDRPMTMHAHREGHLIFHLAGAPGLVSVSGQPHPCNGPSGVAINPWEPHAFQQLMTGTRGLYLVLYINPNWHRRTFGAAESGELFFASTRVFVSSAIAALLCDIWRMMSIRRTLPGFEQALIDLAEECGHAGCRPVDCEVRAGRTGFAGLDFRVRKSIDLLHVRPGESRGRRMDTIARQSGLSRAHFFKLFREHTGITPNLYMNTIQVERALKRVAESAEPVTQIGEDLGFSSQSAFTRFFSAHVGMAPTDYRSAVTVIDDRLSA